MEKTDKAKNLERGLAGAVFLLMVIFFQLLPRGLGQKDLLSISGAMEAFVSLILPLTALALLSAVAVVYGMVSKGRTPLLVALAISGIAGIGLLGASLHWVAFIFISAYSMLYYSNSARRESTERKKISVNRCTLWGLSNMTFTLALGISLAFYLWYNPIVLEQGFQIPAPFVTLSSGLAVSTFTGQGCTEEMLISECITLIADREEERLRANAREKCAGNDICYENSNRLIIEARPEFERKSVESMQNQLGVQIDLNKNVRQTVVDVIEAKADLFFGEHIHFVAPAIALTLFAIMNGASVIIFPLVLFFSTLLFKLLISIGLVKVELRVEQVEEINCG